MRNSARWVELTAYQHMGIRSKPKEPSWTAVADISVLPWCLDEKTGIEHIKYAYEQGVNTFE
jgi:hypothetical protein